MAYEFIPLSAGPSQSKQGPFVTETQYHQTPLHQPEFYQAQYGTRIHKSLINRNDVISLFAVFACFAFAMAAIADSSFAIWLGQTNQLIILGFVLSVMSMITIQRAHALLLILEARFGSSTLQNYDAILRDAKFAPKTSIIIRLALIALFALPLGLSASYKRYIGGRTQMSVSTDEPIQFGLTGPSSLFSAHGRALFTNATSSLCLDRVDPILEELPSNTSYGYNMHVINNTVTAMLDTPIITNTSVLKTKLRRGTFLTISVPVNATFARLNSTPDSPERQDPKYWTRIGERISPDYIVSQPQGLGEYFATWSGWVDTSLIFLSFYNMSKNETFYDKAVGFNLYRGTAQGTWQISSDSTILQTASDFDTDFSPATVHPEVSGDVCARATTPNTPQKIFFCGWSLLSADYGMMIPDYLIGWQDSTGRLVASMSTWVAVVASMAWSSRVGYIGNLGLTGEEFKYLFYHPEYKLSASHPTLRRDIGLFATLAVQPVLLIFVILIRMLFRSTPISEDFGLIALLSGARRQDLRCLEGVSYTGKLKEKVFVQIVVRDDGRRRDQRLLGTGSAYAQTDGPEVEYILSRASSSKKVSPSNVI